MTRVSARTAAMLAVFILLAACRNQALLFEPACIAFSGDRITLSGKRFQWERFTDALRVDPDGNPVDPFPDFPKAGAVERDGRQITLRTDAGDVAGRFELYPYGDALYLIESTAGAAMMPGAVPAECALRQRSR